MKRLMIMVISIVFIFVPMAQAENPVDSTACATNTLTVLHMDKEIFSMGFELKGIVLSNNNSKMFNNVSERCVGLFNKFGDDITQSGYCKYLYPNKDIQIMEWEGKTDGGEWKVIYGTGKWKGVKAQGTWTIKNRVQPITKDSSQHCRSILGSYELPE